MALDRPQVAHLMNDLRPYRLPFLRKVAEHGFDVTLFAGSFPRTLGAPGLWRPADDLNFEIAPVRPLRWPFGGHRVAWYVGALRMLRRRYDVLVLPEVIHSITIWILAGLSRLLKKPVVLFGFGFRHHSKEGGWIGAVRRALRLALLHRADAIAVYSERGQAAVTKMGVDPAKVFTLQNTVDTKWLAALGRQVTDAELTDLNRTLGLDGKRVALFVGRLVPDKRPDLAVRAFTRISKRREDLAFVVVGGGLMRTELEALARGCPAIHFVGPIYDDRRLAVLMKRADLLVIPGRVGLAAVHGFAYGLPVMTTHEGAWQQSPEYDYLQPGFNAVIVPGGTQEEFEVALESTMTEGDLDRLSTGAHVTAEKLPIDAMVEAYRAAVVYALSASARSS